MVKMLRTLTVKRVIKSGNETRIVLKIPSQFVKQSVSKDVDQSEKCVRRPEFGSVEQAAVDLKDERAQKDEEPVVKSTSNTIEINQLQYCELCGMYFACPNSFHRHLLPDNKDGMCENVRNDSIQSVIATDDIALVTEEVQSPPDHVGTPEENLSPQNSKKKSKETKTRKKPVELVPCSHCDRCFAGKSNLKRHMNRVQNKSAKQRYAKDSDERKLQRKMYVRQLRSKEFTCDVCGETCRNWHAYYRHKRTVHDQRYKCRYCDKVFVTPKYLQTHEQRHTHEKSFFCEQCHAGFVSKAELADHIDRKHMDHYLQCDLCNAVLKTPIAFKRHMREYHVKGQKQCPHCEYQGIETNLQRHITNQHYPESRLNWCCRVCGNKYTQKSHLDRHLARVHQLPAMPLAPFAVNNRAILQSVDTSNPSVPLTLEASRQLIEAHPVENIHSIQSHDVTDTSDDVIVPSSNVVSIDSDGLPLTASDGVEQYVDIIEEYPSNDFMVMDPSNSDGSYI